MYDGQSLAVLLRDVGFAEVMVLLPGQTRLTDPGSLDLNERANESVYAEAVQPG